MYEPIASYRYLNCYAMLEEIRMDLNEHSENLVQGSEKGVYDNTDIIRKINAAQMYIFNLLFARFPDYFLTTSSVSGSSGVYTIPSNCYRLYNIINSSGDNIDPINIKVKHKTNYTGSDYLYYRQGNTIVVDSGDSSALTFQYYKFPRNMTQGQSVSGTSTTLTLANTAVAEADYYNNITIENVSDYWTDVISDYTAARVATLTSQTGSGGKYYGTISELPETFHELIKMRAVLYLKHVPVSPQDIKTPEVADFRELLIETLRGFAGTMGNDLSEVFYSFEPYM